MSDEVIEGRVLSDEEVLRMESKERMDDNTRKVIKEQERLIQERITNLYMFEAKNKFPSFFRDL